MTAQTMFFRYELACEGHSTEKAQDLVTQQNDLCCFVGLTFTLYLKLSFFTIFTYIIVKKTQFKIECKGQTYKTAKIILLCHKVLCLFCTVAFTSELITAELGRALAVVKVTLQVNGNSQFLGVFPPKTIGPIKIKSGTNNYVGEGTHMQNLVTFRLLEASPHIGEI